MIEYHYTVKEAMQILRISERAIYHAFNQGLLVRKYIKDPRTFRGYRVRIPESSIKSFLLDNPPK